MENTEDLTRQKQTFLRHEIIEKNYDAGLFVEFLSKLKSDGEDLENWTFEDLKQMVGLFQTQHTPGTDPAHEGDLNESVDEDAAQKPNEPSQLTADQLSAAEQGEAPPEGIATGLISGRDDAELNEPRTEPQVETVKQTSGVDL